MSSRLFLAFLLCTAVAGAEPLPKLIEERQYQEALQIIHARLPQASGAERQRLLLMQADCQVKLVLKEDAALTFTQLQPTHTAPFFRIRGEYNVLRNNSDLARKDFEYAITLPPFAEQLTATLDLASLELDNGHQDLAEQLWNRAVSFSSRHEFSPRNWSAIYLSRLEILLKNGRQEEALTLCRTARAHMQALKYGPGIQTFWLRESNILTFLSRIPEAETAWRRALDLPVRAAGPVLTWGYANLFANRRPDVLRRWLALSESRFSEKWPAYERYHCRVLQGLVCLMGLDEPVRAEHYLKLAEPLAQPTLRRSSNTMTIQLRFDDFGSTDISELGQLLWMRLRALESRGASEDEIIAFMESRIERLSKFERASWLVRLGRSYSQRGAWNRADQALERALQLSEGALRAKLLRAIFDIHLVAGRWPEARRAGAELVTAIPQIAPGEAVELLLKMQTDEARHQPAFQYPTWGPQPDEAILRRQTMAKLVADPKLKALFEQRNQKRIKYFEDANDKFQLSQENFQRALGLIRDERFAEALPVLDKALELATSLPRQATLEYENVRAYAQSQLGESDAALARLTRLQTEFSPPKNPDERGLLWNNQALQMEIRLRNHEPEAALHWNIEPSTWEARQELCYTQARAELDLGHPAQALEALQKCQTHPVPVDILRARSLEALGRHSDAIAELAAAQKIARSLDSVTEADVVVAWHAVDKDAPVAETATRLRNRLNSDSPLLQLAGYSKATAGWMDRREFLAKITSLLGEKSDWMTSMPVLPATLAQQRDGLESERALIQYAIGDHDVVVMVAAREGFLLEKLSVERTVLEGWMRDLKTGDVAASHSLHRILLAPFIRNMRGKTLTFIAQGSLLSLPWDVLESDDGRPFVQDFAWSIWAGEASHAAVSLQHILAVGDVQGAELPATARELDAIAAEFPGKVDRIQGKQATVAQLRAFLPTADVLHIATHSHANVLPGQSDIALTDGPLTAQQIYALPLKPGALVVLSSCGSADTERQGRGPVTLASAFLAAGASQVIATLAPVGDDETALLISDLYHNLARGQSPVQALRSAKLARLTAGGGHDWSSFVLLKGF